MSLAPDILAAALVVVTLLPATRLRPWWVKIWDFPRLQIAFCGGVVLTLGAALGMHAPVAAALAAAVIWQAVPVLPYTRLWSARCRATPS